MKRIAAILLLPLFLAVAAQASPGAHTVSTNAVTVLPARPIMSATTWSTNATSVVGQVFKYSDGTYRMAKVAGALPASPTTDYPQVFSGGRGFLTVQNTGATDIYVAFGEAAVSGAGLKLAAGAVASVNDYQGLVSVVSSAAGGSVTTTEVPDSK